MDCNKWRACSNAWLASVTDIEHSYKNFIPIYEALTARAQVGIRTSVYLPNGSCFAFWKGRPSKSSIAALP